MGRGKKAGLIILVIIIGVPLLAFTAVRLKYTFDSPKVIALAQEYLEQKYDQEMDYIRITYPIIEAPYRVCFSPANNPDLIITVRVRSDMSLRDENIVGGIHFMPDDYYMVYFETQMADFFENDIRRIWKDSATTSISISSRAAAASFRVPAGLNDQLSLWEMEALIEEYLLFVNVDTMLNEDAKVGEAQKIFDFIQGVQKSKYNPTRLVFWYQAPKTVIDASGRTNLSFEDWMNIDSIEKVITQMDGQYFNK
jgi:hypothetical protein